MDGLPQTLALQSTNGGSFWSGRSGRTTQQRTLKTSIGCVGVGLHSGRKVSLTLHPAACGTGIVFRRTDLAPADGGIDIPARFDLVADTRLCTVVANPAHPEARVGTAEHLLAALSGCGIHNALITLDGPEVPILDGSAASFAFLIDCAGIVEQTETAAAIEILRPIRVSQGDAYADLLPGGPGFEHDAVDRLRRCARSARSRSR